uniref:THAP-type domain-containing protein n=1 Tax=Neogobius melanostomus TaxID=47308 RepID=A0A8C6UWI7_9GOBI
MVNRCCVKGCKSDTLKQKVDRTLHLYKFPAVKTHFGPQMEDISRKRRLAWISAVGIKNISFEHIAPHERVCSLHFHKGKPAYEMMENDPDWAPSLHLGHSDLAYSDEDASEHSSPETEELSPAVNGTLQTEEEQPQDSIDSFRAEISSFWDENRELRQQLDMKYFTGLSGVPLLSNEEKPLSPFQMLLLTLMRLRLDLPVHLLAHLFLVSPNTVCSVFSKTVSLLYTLLKCEITWPDRDTLRRSKPHQFVKEFVNRIAVNIDCFEILVEKMANVKTRDRISLTYKHNHSIKYLIGLTPKGHICVLSQGWGGRVNDEQITLHSGFLLKLLPGDTVVADRGFDIQESEDPLCAEVKHPAFTNRTFQLEDRDVGEPAKISQLKSHVRRVFGNVCQKYKLLSGTVPIALVLQCEGEELTLLDKIVMVCCVFTNLCPTVV